MQEEIGNALLVVTMEVEPEWQEEFNRWYNEYDLPVLLKAPGFLGVRRFVAVEGEPQYLAVYQLKDEGVVQSEPYTSLRAEIAANSWTKQVRPHARSNRTVYRQIFPPQGVFADRAGPKPLTQ